MNFLIDQEPTRPLAQVRRDAKQQAAVFGNERLIALVGTVLLVLIGAEIIIAMNMHALMSIHIFVGVLLTVPLFVKIGSTGYRFLHYYTGSPAFVQKGPPRLEMRLLAPLLLLTSLSLITSGITLALLGPINEWSVWVLRLHALSVMCWLPLLVLHVGAYIWRMPRLLLADWQKRAIRRVPGRWWRYTGTLVTYWLVWVRLRFFSLMRPPGQPGNPIFPLTFLVPCWQPCSLHSWWVWVVWCCSDPGVGVSSHGLARQDGLPTEDGATSHLFIHMVEQTKRVRTFELLTTFSATTVDIDYVDYSDDDNSTKRKRKSGERTIGGTSVTSSKALAMTPRTSETERAFVQQESQPAEQNGQAGSAIYLWHSHK